MILMYTMILAFQILVLTLQDQHLEDHKIIHTQEGVVQVVHQH